MSSTTSPPRPAKASLTFSGDATLAGPAGNAEVTCNFPDVAGTRIAVLALAPGGSSSYRVAVANDRVFVQVDQGAGPTFRERNFEGTGVRTFDAGRGTQFEARLADAAPTLGVERGTIGRITAVKGSIDCGDQTPGSSTLTVTGTTPAGRYEAARLDPVVVECYFASGQVTAIGVARAGTTKVLLMVTIEPDGVNVEEAPANDRPRYYSPVHVKPGSAMLVAGGARADNDVSERNTSQPHTLHVAGAVTCGRPIRS